jgi:carboxymethylenebutenolidase
MSRTEVAIPTPDGPARAFAFHPEGAGAWPAVIFYMDAPAIRPALFQMCERLAGHGYFVLLPDMFWRAGPYEPINIAEAFKDEEARRERFAKFRGSTDTAKGDSDTAACLEWLLHQPQVKGTKVGVTGYCMGGGLSLRAAGLFPDRVIASAGFHGGRLATDHPDSPHLMAPKMKAKVYVGGADEDAGFPPEQADRLREALNAAGVANTVEIYAGARHGYAPPDMPVYNKQASERHWTEMLKLFDETLKAKVEA